MSITLRIVITFTTMLLLTSCTEIETSCAPTATVTPLCGVQMPEDIEALPDGGGLLIGEFGNMGQLPGALTWYQPASGADFVRLATSDTITGTGPTGERESGDGERWGQADCAVPEQLSPHGIHLANRGDRLQLLVVNHGAREQVLFYEVQPATDGPGAPTLVWRGCVDFPPSAVLNDVAALPGGGFAVTHMYKRENELLAQLKSSLGLNKGHVWLWYPGGEPQILANSQARMPNGIEVAEDGKSIWVNNYIEQELRQYAIPDGDILSRFSAPNIDNSAWLPDGRLLLASHLSPLALLPCFGVTEGSCGAGYELIAVDTVSGAQDVLFRSEGGGPFGPATVALPYRGKWYAGSFSGDRLAELKLQ